MSNRTTIPTGAGPARADHTHSLITLLDAASGCPAPPTCGARSYHLLRLHAGAPVVDVGCGRGTAVAELTAHGAATIGVDPDDGMLAVARQRRPEADFRAGDAYRLPLEDGHAVGYRADKVLHELADPLRALVEARRVLAPGGRVVLLGQDWDTTTIDSDEPALTRAIVRARADTIANPRVARRYRNLLLDTGFGDVAV